MNGVSYSYRCGHHATKETRRKKRHFEETAIGHSGNLKLSVIGERGGRPAHLLKIGRKEGKEEGNETTRFARYSERLILKRKRGI
jgi:hypothetical protein